MIDITGQRFGLLEVEGIAYVKKEYFWKCKCDCGNETVVSGYKLRSGYTKSCGCLQKKHREEGFNKKHGKTDTPLYIKWINMRARCYYVKNWMYKNYGGRGITVCDEWKNDFEIFEKWAYESGYKEGLTIDRIDVDKGYSPENCRWVTKETQYLNRTDSHYITAFGVTKTIKEWSDESGIKYDTIERRINRYGWKPEDAVTKKTF